MPPEITEVETIATEPLLPCAETVTANGPTCSLSSHVKEKSLAPLFSSTAIFVLILTNVGAVFSAGFTWILISPVSESPPLSVTLYV